MTAGNFSEEAIKHGGRTLVMVLRRLLVALKTRWWIPLVTTALAVVGAAFYVAQMPPPVYVSTARMWVTGKMKVPEGSTYMEEAQQYYGTQAELMQSKRIVARAHSKVQAEHPEISYTPIRVVVNKSPQAAILILNAVGQDPTYPRIFLEALMSEFLMFKREAKSESAESTQAQVSQQKFKSEEDLKVSLARLEEFQKEKPLAVMTSESQAARDNYSRYNKELTERKIELQSVTQMIDLGEMPDDRNARVGIKSDDPISPDTRNSVNLNEPRDTDYKTTKQRIAQLKIRRQELSEYMKPAHPKIVEFDQSIESLEKMMSVYEGQSREDLIKAREGLKRKIENLDRQLADANAEVIRTDKILQEAGKIKTAIDLAQRQVDGFSQILRSVDMGNGMDQETLQVLEPATTPMANPLQKLPPVLGGGVLGLFLGLGIVLMLVWVDDRLGSLAELRANVDCLVVGQVPEIPLKKGEGRLQLLEPDDSRHHFAESYRNIRSSLLFMATDGVRPKTILITSSIPAEGKSTVSSNLARAMAFTGSKVLLIEGDQRRGMLHEMFHVPIEPGLAEVLRGQKGLSEVMHQTNLPNLSFISRGKPPGNPGELFLGTMMDRVLQDVYNQFDYILIDSAPVLAADDTTSLAPKMDGVLFVVRNSYTSAKLMRQSMDLLEQRQVRVLGVVYNRADSRSGDYNYYNYPQYYITAPPEAKPEKNGKAKAKGKGKKAKVNGEAVNGSETKSGAAPAEPPPIPVEEEVATAAAGADGGESTKA